jgi:hypothetical protein
MSYPSLPIWAAARRRRRLVPACSLSFCQHLICGLRSSVFGHPISLNARGMCHGVRGPRKLTKGEVASTAALGLLPILRMDAGDVEAHADARPPEAGPTA